MLLHFMHAVTGDRDRVQSFVFGTRLTNVTRQLRARDVDLALARIGDLVEDWSGGTRIGHCLHAFNRVWSRRVLGQGAIVLLITDGLDRDAGEGLEREMERLHKSCRRLIWLNPLLRFDGYAPLATGARAIIRHVDDFRPVHNLDEPRRPHRCPHPHRPPPRRRPYDLAGHGPGHAAPVAERGERGRRRARWPQERARASLAAMAAIIAREISSYRGTEAAAGAAGRSQWQKAERDDPRGDRRLPRRTRSDRLAGSSRGGARACGPSATTWTTSSATCVPSGSFPGPRWEMRSLLVSLAHPSCVSDLPIVARSRMVEG